MQPDWESRYLENSTGWDLGSISTPLKEYFDQLENKELKILIPGCGNAYEAEYLWKKGFKNIYLIDLAPSPLKNFQEKNPDFPKEHLIQGDFFHHEGWYDLIVEQTFFCAIEPTMRRKYADKMIDLLADGGKLVGLVWSVELNTEHPPYGGSKEEYVNYFTDGFETLVMNNAYNSIAPRANREMFMILRKKAKK